MRFLTTSRLNLFCLATLLATALEVTAKPSPERRSDFITPQPICRLQQTPAEQLLGLCDDAAEIFMATNAGRLAPACEMFMDSIGQVGPVGKLIVDSIARIDRECFYQIMDVSSVCPRFPELSPSQQSRFWVWVFASIAQVESSCRLRVDAQGINGTADGLFQLEYSYALRRAAGRDPELCRTRGPTDSADPTFQVECAISIFRDHHCRGDRVRSLTYRGGYWQKLNGPNRAIARLIRHFPGCQ